MHSTPRLFSILNTRAYRWANQSRYSCNITCRRSLYGQRRGYWTAYGNASVLTSPSLWSAPGALALAAITSFAAYAYGLSRAPQRDGLEGAETNNNKSPPKYATAEQMQHVGILVTATEDGISYGDVLGHR